MPLRDETEYQFATPGRRLVVRGGPTEAGVADAGAKYAQSLKDYLGASDVRVNPPVSTSGGAEAVLVSGIVPGRPGGPASAVRTAFLRFGTGPLAELTLEAQSDDAGAEAEFGRLFQTAQPSSETNPVEEVARAIEAGPVGQPGHPAGPIQLQLTPDYQGRASFALRSADGTVGYRLEAVLAPEATPTAVEETILGTGVSHARDEEGRSFRYEAGVRPRLWSRRSGTLEAARIDELVMREAVPRPSAVVPGEAVVEGRVRGKAVRLKVAVSSEGSDPQRLGEELIRTMDQRR
jgi:hypothetical protein